jgi:D-alanyl-lipoteichoic acid acyltransferase DltB (MBOAT superfamily)
MKKFFSSWVFSLVVLLLAALVYFIYIVYFVGWDNRGTEETRLPSLYIFLSILVLHGLRYWYFSSQKTKTK